MSGNDPDTPSRSLSGLDTLVDLKSEAASSVSRIPSIIFDPNRFRLERMLQESHLVYGVPTPFLGREQAHATLVESLSRVEQSGRLHLTTLTGSPGSGKTRLLAEVFATTSAVSRGVEITGASCSESEAVDGIAIVGQLLRRRFEVAPRLSTEDALQLVRTAIEPLVEPDYVEMAASQLGYLMGLDVPHVANEVPKPEGQERYQVMALSTCLNLLAVHASRATQVLVFHRAQFLTQGGRSFLAGLITALAETPTLILLLADGSIQLSGLPDTMSRDELVLLPLKPAEMEHLVGAILQRLGTPPKALISHIVNRSAGNPRLVEDNIRLLVQKGVLTVDDDRWVLCSEALDEALDLADTHQAASAARIQYLASDVRHVLSLATVFGATFWFEGVLNLLRAYPGSAPEADAPWITDPVADWLERVLQGAIADGFVRLHNTSSLQGEREYSFSGPRDRDMLYEAIAPHERTTQHRLAGQWLAGLGLEHPIPWHGIVAEHWETGEQPVEAARWYERAARGARDVYDLTHAKALYQRALALVDLDQVHVLLPVLEGFAEVCFTAAEFNDARRAYRALGEASLLVRSRRIGARAWLMQGRAHRCLGDYKRAQLCFQHAESLCRTDKDEAGLANALEQRGILLRLEGADGACDIALDLFQQSLELRQRDGDVGAVAKSLENIASTHLQQGRLPDAQSGLEQALELRRQLGDISGQAGPLGNMGLVRHAQGDVTGALNAWRSGLSIAEQIGDRELVGIFFNNIGEGYFELGEYALAKTALTDARAIATETGDQRTLADVLRNLGALALARGDWNRGLAAVDEAIGLCQRMGSRLGLGQALRTRGEILGHQLYADSTMKGREPHEATGCFKDALEIFDDMGDQIELEKTLHSYGRFLTDRGVLKEAKAVLARAHTLKRARERS
ncbi:MAG: ATP-binding protein [Myxococcota bacterium]